MILTVEPGIYVGEKQNKFQNIGVRIEDDVLITDGDPVVLSGACPKEVAEIEKLIGTGNAKLF